MLRWVPCLGSPSPVEAGFWSALRTPGSLSASVGQRAHARHPSGAGAILRRLLGRDHANKELVELSLIDLGRGAEHEVGHRLRLRKRNDVADVVRAAEHHHDAIDTGCNAAMRWDSVRE